MVRSLAENFGYEYDYACDCVRDRLPVVRAALIAEATKRALADRDDFQQLRDLIDRIRTTDEIGKDGISTWDRDKLARLREDLLQWYGRVYMIGCRDGRLERDRKQV